MTESDLEKWKRISEELYCRFKEAEIYYRQIESDLNKYFKHRKFSYLPNLEKSMRLLSMTFNDTLIAMNSPIEGTPLHIQEGRKALDIALKKAKENIYHCPECTDHRCDLFHYFDEAIQSLKDERYGK